MKKDLFDYIVVPTDKEYRKENVIDEIYGIPKLNIPQQAYLFKSRDYLINDAIVNYNNEIVVAKTFYANMVKYQKYFEKRNNEEYDFWARKYAEQVIKELYSIYDKSIHIVNYLYDLKIKPDINFKRKVSNEIKNRDKKFYDKMNSIYNRLYCDNLKKVFRNDITHNFSNLFFRYKPIYEGNRPTGWYVEDAISFEEYKNLIDDICCILSENKNLIIGKLSAVYPVKGSEEYKRIKQELIDKLKLK